MDSHTINPIFHKAWFPSCIALLILLIGCFPTNPFWETKPDDGFDYHWFESEGAVEIDGMRRINLEGYILDASAALPIEGALIELFVWKPTGATDELMNKTLSKEGGGFHFGSEFGVAGYAENSSKQAKWARISWGAGGWLRITKEGFETYDRQIQIQLKTMTEGATVERIGEIKLIPNR